LPFVELYEFHFYYKTSLQELDFTKNMSLSYFFNYGYDMQALSQYESIVLTTKGWFMLILMLFGTPLLVTFRISLKNESRKNQ
jgi:hypothetical protein